MARIKLASAFAGVLRLRARELNDSAGNPLRARASSYVPAHRPAPPIPYSARHSLEAFGAAGEQAWQRTQALVARLRYELDRRAAYVGMARVA